ncbi:UNVERIFIED_CONTAM: hypothetical protein Sradi_5728900 [Sesamum radiatum]|uniref:Uncharacterized protein n=1 Tax=Sesamum radiatum TaxID=300843 RepID=A0AAW2L4X3_SESRA
MWTRELGCEATILRAWGSTGAGSGGGRLAQNLHEVGQELEAWEKTSFHNVKWQIKMKEEELLSLTEGSSDAATGL